MPCTHDLPERTRQMLSGPSTSGGYRIQSGGRRIASGVSSKMAVLGPRRRPGRITKFRGRQYTKIYTAHRKALHRAAVDPTLTPRPAMERERMSYVQVAHTRMITHENGVTGVYVQVAQPVSNLSAALFAHDSIDVAWRVGLTFKPSDNPLIWQAGTKLDPSLPPLLEVGNFIESTDTFLGRLAPGPVRFVHVRPVGDTGIWAEGPAAQVELARVEAERAQRFMQPIVAPGSAQDAPEFVILAVAEGLLITQPQRVPGISLTPFKAELGDDVMNVLNRIIRGRGIRTILDPQA